jgi:hydroxylamine oxidation protein HaoB
VKRAIPVAGVALAAGGALLVGWIGWTALNPPPPPYHYELVADGGVDKFPELGLQDQAGLALKKYEIRTESVDKPVAVAHVGTRGDGAPVLLSWQNSTAEPVLRLGPAAGELTALAAAVARHAPPQSRILAWSDTSRQLQLLAGSSVVFEENLVAPLLLPPPWRAAHRSIESLERDFWRAPASSQTEQRFAEFADAMLSELPAGLEKLRRLAGGGEAYVVVHLTDAYRLGALEPERLGVGFKDFPMTGQMHGTINAVKSWLKKAGHRAYALERRDDTTVRVHFLTDEASTRTLLAKLLPFDTSNPLALDAPTVVYQHGGYWVYKLPPSAGQVETAAADPRP